jgi:hypothetical protein
MNGTELRELEQLMMLVPNFMPRKSGMIVLHGINGKALVSKFNPCSCGGRQYQMSKSDNKKSESIITEKDNYKDILFTSFKNQRSFRLNERLIDLARNYDGELFTNDNHRLRFYSVCRLQDVISDNINSWHLATLYIITADENLWSCAKEHVYSDFFDFKSMHLRGINTDGYALYQTARTIMLEREYIKLSEIADKALVGDIAFKAIINGVLISKYGSTMLNLND